MIGEFGLRSGRRSGSSGALRTIPRRVAAPVVAAAATAVLLISGLVASGRLTVVVTHGVSMQPLYHQGDLVIVARAPAYHVGQIVAYRVPARHLVVLHRLITERHDYLAFKGDNNQSVDPWHPSRAQLVGHAVLHVPQGGLWLQRATSPLAIAVVIALLLIGGSTTYRRRRRRRRMAAHARTVRTRPPNGNPALPPAWRGLAVTLASLAVLGLALAGLAWTTPRSHVAASTSQQHRQMAFSYSARVRPSAAYTGTVVRSPDPVFRKLARTVDVQFRYAGPPGELTVSAQLTAPSGWHTELALTPQAGADGDGNTHTVRLDLPALEAKAAAAASATGMPTVPLDVAVVPTVTTTSGRAFAPALHLRLDPLQLKLAEGTNSLTVSAVTPITTHVRQPRQFRLAGHTVTVSALRVLSLVVVACGVLGCLALIVATRRLRKRSAADAVSRRYNVRVVEIHPLAGPPDRPVIEVRTVADLVQLATQLALPVLHWTQPGVDTFAVHDEFVVYRTALAAPVSEPGEGAALTAVGGR
jgi:signal peptidase I